MGKEKVTITVDRNKIAEARTLLGVTSSSAAIDIALSELIRRARLQRDVEAYTRTPPTSEEAALGRSWDDPAGLLDDTDWDSEWPESR